MFGIVSGEARRLPTTPAGRSPWVDRLLLALVLSVVVALLASIALAVVGLLPSSAPAQQPVQTKVDVPAVVVPIAPAVVDVPRDMPSTNIVLTFSEPLDWQFVETEIHSLYKDTSPFFMRGFIGWFRAQDGSIRPIAEFTGNSMLAKDKLGASIDGVVLARDQEISIDGAKHWVNIKNLPTPLDDDGFTWARQLRGGIRIGEKVVIYASYDFSHPEAKISATKWYQVEMLAATLEELSR